MRTSFGVGAFLILAGFQLLPEVWSPYWWFVVVGIAFAADAFGTAVHRLADRKGDGR